MWQAIVKFIEDNGKNPLVVAIVAALLGALLTKLLPWIFNKLGKLGGTLAALFGGRWQDYAFEKRYLDWLIGRHRFLGQLPSNVAVATGEQAQLAELEQIYVALSVTPGGAGPSDESTALPREVELMRHRPAGWMDAFYHRAIPSQAQAAQRHWMLD